MNPQREIGSHLHFDIQITFSGPYIYGKKQNVTSYILCNFPFYLIHSIQYRYYLFHVFSPNKYNKKSIFVHHSGRCCLRTHTVTSDMQGNIVKVVHLTLPLTFLT